MRYFTRVKSEGQNTPDRWCGTLKYREDLLLLVSTFNSGGQSGVVTKDLDDRRWRSEE